METVTTHLKEDCLICASFIEQRKDISGIESLDLFII